LGSFSSGKILRPRGGCGGVGVLNEVKEIFRGFFEEVFEAVSYVVATVIVLAAFELKISLKSRWNSVWRRCKFEEG